MTYCLTAVTTNEDKVTKIQQKASSQLTRMYGFEVTFPKASVYGPKEFGGKQH
jgi:hypothetical protein